MRLDVILRVVAKFILPTMMLFALYVQFHGDYGPGGGFQAGVIVAATIIIYALIFGLPATVQMFPPGIVETCVPLGVLIYAGVGLLGIVTGGNYLDYSQLAHDPAHGQEWGVLLVELGVFVTVASSLVAIFYMFAGRAR
jgi:multicomponent Na+:H+ antiporter subunit B